MRPTLQKLLRGGTTEVLDAVHALAADPLRLEASDGTTLMGDEGASGHAIAVTVNGTELGRVIGGRGAEQLAMLVTHFAAKELEKRALVTETLGRYKELTLIYDLSEQLSAVLEVESMAAAVVAQAQRHLRADSASLLRFDERARGLVVLSAVGDELSTGQTLPADHGLAGRVFATGRSEFLEDVSGSDAHVSVDGHVGSLICAPLRAGERVLGVLRVTHPEPGRWSSGDLKLVTALAALAASSISNAELQSERLQELALRHQVERLVAPRLLEAVFDGAASPSVEGAVVFCDLRSVAATTLDARDLLGLLEAQLATCVDVLLGQGAAVDTPRGELVLGVFIDDDGFREAARRAVHASRAMASALATSLPDGADSAPGIGVAHAVVEPSGQALPQGINLAAALQAEAHGRILADAAVAAALDDDEATALTARELPSGNGAIHEVHP